MGNLPYLPHTEADIRAMLEKIGVKKLEDLYSDVPSEFLKKGAYALPEALSEQEIRDYFASLEAMNARLKVFVGQGAYDHYTPAVIPYLCSRSEFLTAYTPYQCEISQGTLRYIFEYQTLMCELTGEFLLYLGLLLFVNKVRLGNGQHAVLHQQLRIVFLQFVQ